ncbi:anti-sigma factor [Nocardioides jiangxiensis]|uniref:Regulator of SigK n=1 Tax=Nocardioides jiangxiensis TaxID=3064524 RepID=A0ABT9B005_9ACTN|nr:anti-sigma factor [Nocardioides sp. WY-20]MDO7868042.1 anti-sigma factor [Nocardioides sp. WY-20]
MSEIHALSGAYAIDALDEHERALFERHLAECADCRAEVDSLRGAAASLAETTIATPPPALRADVLAAISTVRPLPPLPAQESGVHAGGRRFRHLLVAAAAVAVVGTGAAVTHPWTDDRVDPVQQVIAASDSDQATAKVDGAKLTVYRSASLGKAALVTDELPAAAKGKVYELWLQVDGAMVPAGLLEGSGDQELLLTGDASKATAAGITVEPDGGSRQPTSTPIALFDLTQDT